MSRVTCCVENDNARLCCTGHMTAGGFEGDASKAAGWVEHSETHLLIRAKRWVSQKLNPSYGLHPCCREVEGGNVASACGRT